MPAFNPDVAANPQRGDVECTIGDHRLVLRPSFTALVAIETRAGMGLIALWRKFSDGQAGIREAMSVLEPAVVAAHGGLPPDLGESVARAGLLVVLPQLGRFLAQALAGDEASQGPSGGNVEAAAGEPARSPGAATAN